MGKRSVNRLNGAQRVRPGADAREWRRRRALSRLAARTLHGATPRVPTEQEFNEMNALRRRLGMAEDTWHPTDRAEHIARMQAHPDLKRRHVDAITQIIQDNAQEEARR